MNIPYYMPKGWYQMQADLYKAFNIDFWLEN